MSIGKPGLDDAFLRLSSQVCQLTNLLSYNVYKG